MITIEMTFGRVLFRVPFRVDHVRKQEEHGEGRRDEALKGTRRRPKGRRTEQERKGGLLHNSGKPNG